MRMRALGSASRFPSGPACQQQRAHRHGDAEADFTSRRGRVQGGDHQRSRGELPASRQAVTKHLATLAVPVSCAASAAGERSTSNSRPTLWPGRRDGWRRSAPRRTRASPGSRRCVHQSVGADPTSGARSIRPQRAAPQCGSTSPSPPIARRRRSLPRGPRSPGRRMCHTRSPAVAATSASLTCRAALAHWSK
jgi:hypothetical protein